MVSICGSHANNRHSKDNRKWMMADEWKFCQPSAHLTNTSRTRFSRLKTNVQEKRKLSLLSSKILFLKPAFSTGSLWGLLGSSHILLDW